MSITLFTFTGVLALPQPIDIDAQDNFMITVTPTLGIQPVVGEFLAVCSLTTASVRLYGTANPT
jgi:hypothetical protein